MASIIRGTTPSFIVDFTDITDIELSDVDSVSLIMKHGSTETDLSDGTVISTTANTISYHFSQTETLALTAGVPVFLEMDILMDDGEVYRTAKKKYDVADSFRDEEME